MYPSRTWRQSKACSQPFCECFFDIVVEENKEIEKGSPFKDLVVKDMTEASEDEVPLIPSPATGKPGTLTGARAFNLMFETNVGPYSDGASKSYLRPETAQGIFVNFKQVTYVMRQKIPFGIATWRKVCIIRFL